MRSRASSVTFPPQLPLGQRSSSYSHASRPRFAPASARALMQSNHSSPMYSVISPERECMKNPPKPICSITSIWRSSSPFSSSPFHDQKGFPRYALPGRSNCARSSFPSIALSLRRPCAARSLNLPSSIHNVRPRVNRRGKGRFANRRRGRSGRRGMDSRVCAEERRRGGSSQRARSGARRERSRSPSRAHVRRMKRG